jgi:hypothetical protein
MGFDPNRFKARETVVVSPPELRNPRGDEDIRVHATWRYPDVEMAKASGKFFVVDQDLHSALSGRRFTCELRAAISGNGDVFVWPIKQNDEVLAAAADKATSEWIRIKWTDRKHEVLSPAEPHGDPTWKFGSFDELLDQAVANRILTDPEDETVKKILAKKRRGQKKQ